MNTTAQSEAPTIQQRDGRVVAVAGTFDFVRRSSIGWGVCEIVRQHAANASIVTRDSGDVEIWIRALAAIDNIPCTVHTAREQLCARRELSFLQAQAQRDRSLIDACTEMLLFWDGASRDIAVIIGFARKAGRPFTVFALDGEPMEAERAFEAARAVEAETRAAWKRDSPPWMPPTISVAGTRF